MQQDINIIKATEEDIALHENGVVSELKQIAEEKSNLAERQRTIIENQKDIIFKLNNEKDRMQRDVNTLKQEMEMSRSRKLFIYRFTFFKINSFEKFEKVLSNCHGDPHERVLNWSGPYFT